MLEQQCSIFVSITFFSLGILFGLVLQIIAFIVNLKTTNQNLIIYVIFFFFLSLDFLIAKYPKRCLSCLLI